MGNVHQADVGARLMSCFDRASRGSDIVVSIYIAGGLVCSLLRANVSLIVLPLFVVSLFVYITSERSQ